MNVRFDVKPGDEALTIAGARRENPRFFLVAGLILMADGLAAIALIPLMGFPAEKTAAGLLAVSGLTLLFHALSARGGSQVIPLEFLMALLHLTLGLIGIWDPFMGAFTFAQWLGGFLLAEGALRVAIAVNFRGARGAAAVARTGAVELVLGIVLLVLFAQASDEVVGWFLGLDLILGGICMVGIFRTGRAPCSVT